MARHETSLLASGVPVNRAKRDVWPTSVGSPTSRPVRTTAPCLSPRRVSLPLHLLLTVRRRARLNDVIKALGLSTLE